MIKKRVLILIVFLMVFFLPLINAGSLGISPAKQEFYFEPGIEKTFTFKIVSASSEQITDLYVKGDLAEYVNLSKESVVGQDSFEVYIKLPNKIEIPGKHRILIGAKEHVDELDSGVKGLVVIQVPIYVLVPYPGKYAEASFKISDINEGENAVFELEIFNFGTEKISPNSRIDIYKDEKRTEKIKTKIIEPQEIKSKERILIIDEINTSDFKPGPYFVTVNIDYSKIIEIDDEFKIGTLLIKIIDYSNEFEEGKINKFKIEIESLWNYEIENVYGEVSVTDNGKIIDQFKTPTIDLNSWEKANLTGFFDASEVEEGKYVANLKIFYEDKSIYKLVSIYVIKLGLNSLLLIGGTAGIILIVAVLILIICLIIKIHKLKKNGKKFKKK